MSDPTAVNPRVVVHGVDPELLHLLIEVALPALELSRSCIHFKFEISFGCQVGVTLGVPAPGVRHTRVGRRS